MKSVNFKFTLLSVISVIALLFSFSSCEKTKSCPTGNLCIEGNRLEYQSSPEKAKLIIDAPEGAVYANTAVVITDLVPFYPANADYGTYERHFAGGLFKIEPTDLDIKKFVTISIEYTADGFTTYIGDNYESELILYYIDKDDNWSIVNASKIDMDKNMVSAQVTRLGTYAVGAKKDFIIGEWHYGTGITNYSFNISYTFNNQGKGKKEIVTACDDDFTIYDIMTMEFHWKYLDNKILLYDFSPTTGCGLVGGASPDFYIEYEYDVTVNVNELTINDGNIGVYHRYF